MDSVEWSFACPGSGIDLDSCAALTSDLAGEVVPGVSMAGGPASTPRTFARGSFCAAVAAGPVTFLAEGDFSEQPVAAIDAISANAVVTRFMFKTLMINSG